ncbi:hypothetical protein L210DRAFT_3585322 [Boletus edulis BED1]|uniref:Uncharacterized protein n=1 Tax=Boletus edulis BED1 TaxID=1328754 RepID=A0AAD4G5S2_BOLED|nr:hypothetical protein L210DRAFT_3585322 [Boletus edulis BED1]
MLGLGINLHASPQLHPPYIEAVILKTTGRDSFAPETIDIKISIGDSILLDIHNSSATTGHVFIENLTNNESANRDSAGWFVSDVMDGSGNTYTLADYGTVIFTGASAGTQGGASYSPDGATIVQNVGRKAENEAEGAYKMSTTTVTNDGALRIMYLKYQ